MKIKLVCLECGKEPVKNDEKSTDIWEVFDDNCKYCGGSLKPVVEQGGV